VEDKVPNKRRRARRSAQPSGGHVRLLSFVAATIAIAGCTARPVTKPPSANWKRVSGTEAGCVSYGSNKGEAVDRNVVLTAQFQEQLVAQLDPSDRTEPLCWYETPEGLIRVFAGNWCAGGTQSDFEEKPTGWVLVQSSMVFITCRDAE